MKVETKYGAGAYSLLPVSPCLLLLVCFGCAAVETETVHDGTPRGIRSPLAASENPVVGTVVWSDPVAREAVVRLSDPAPLPAGFLVARNSSLANQAIMKATEIRRGRTVGVRILAGSTAEGDVVVVPGPRLRTEIEASLPIDAGL